MSETGPSLGDKDINFSSTPRLPGGPLAEHALWENIVSFRDDGKPTETGVRTPDGEFFGFDHGESFVQIQNDSGQRDPFVRTQDGQEVPFAAWRASRRQEIASVLAQADKDYSAAYLAALSDSPHLEQMQMEAATKEQYPVLQYTGGFWKRPDDGKLPPKIVVNMSQETHYDELIRDREVSARKSAEAIGIDFEVMKRNPAILKLFIFLHEVGHVEDYVVNYLQPSLRDGSDPLVKNIEQRQKELDSLPVPRANPVQTRQMYDRGELQPYYEKYKQFYEGKGIKSPEELLSAQEEAYHELPSEVYPDQFAASVLKKHWNELFPVLN